MIDLEEFQRRVDAYFQCGQRNEPGGRIILDLMRALREETIASRPTAPTETFNRIYDDLCDKLRKAGVSNFMIEGVQIALMIAYRAGEASKQ